MAVTPVEPEKVAVTTDTKKKTGSTAASFASDLSTKSGWQIWGGPAWNMAKDMSREAFWGVVAKRVGKKNTEKIRGRVTDATKLPQAALRLATVRPPPLTMLFQHEAVTNVPFVRAFHKFFASGTPSIGAALAAPSEGKSTAAVIVLNQLATLEKENEDGTSDTLLQDAIVCCYISLHEHTTLQNEINSLLGLEDDEMNTFQLFKDALHLLPSLGVTRLNMVIDQWGHQRDVEEGDAIIDGIGQEINRLDKKLAVHILIPHSKLQTFHDFSRLNGGSITQVPLSYVQSLPPTDEANVMSTFELSLNPDEQTEYQQFNSFRMLAISHTNRVNPVEVMRNHNDALYKNIKEYGTQIRLHHLTGNDPHTEKFVTFPDLLYKCNKLVDSYCTLSATSLAAVDTNNEDLKTFAPVTTLYWYSTEHDVVKEISSQTDFEDLPNGTDVYVDRSSVVNSGQQSSTRVEVYVDSLSSTPIRLNGHTVGDIVNTLGNRASVYTVKRHRRWRIRGDLMSHNVALISGAQYFVQTQVALWVDGQLEGVISDFSTLGKVWEQYKLRDHNFWQAEMVGDMVTKNLAKRLGEGDKKKAVCNLWAERKPRRGDDER